MKQCSKCKEGKDESEFNGKIKKNGQLQPQCRECQKEYRNNHRGYFNQKLREYRNEHKEELNQYNREYRSIHKEELNRKSRENGNSPLKYNLTSQKRKKIGLYEEIKESKNGNVEIKCAYCGDGFEPVEGKIKDRISAIEGMLSEGSECRLYCSEKCKENCTVHGQRGYEKGYQPTTSREVQPELRKIVFARDNYTCQHCNTHKDNLEIGIHCHHKEGVQGNPIESADVDICITLCEDCHNEVHKQPGFRYEDLKCSPHLKYNI